MPAAGDPAGHEPPAPVAAAAPAGDLAVADGAGTAAAAAAGGEEIGRITKPAGVVLYEAPAADAETGRIRIRCLKTCKKLPGQTIVATFLGGEISPIAEWQKVEYNPNLRTKLICNGETNAAATIIGSVVKNVYGFTDATLKTKKQPGKPLFWIPPVGQDMRLVETFLALQGVEPRFVMELCTRDGETMLAPMGVAMVLSVAVPVTNGTEVTLAAKSS